MSEYKPQPCLRDGALSGVSVMELEFYWWMVMLFIRTFLFRRIFLFLTQMHRDQDISVLHSSEILHFSVVAFKVSKQFLGFIRAALCPHQCQNLLQPFVILEFHLLGNLMATVFSTKGCCLHQGFLGIAHAVIPFLSGEGERYPVGGSENL